MGPKSDSQSELFSTWSKSASWDDYTRTNDLNEKFYRAKLQVIMTMNTQSY